ncbi:MAG: hypothetical protein WD689_05795 [Gaiellaceae bacterium]
MPELEAALRQLAAEIAWPPERNLAPGVTARLRKPKRRWLALAAVPAAALAVAFAVPPARSAILDFFGIGGVEIRRVDTLPGLSTERAAPGIRVPLAEALNSVAFDVVVPDGYRSVYLEAGIVTFVWPDRLLMQFEGDELVLKKILAEDTSVEWLGVAGHMGVWIEGAPHGLFLPGGEKRRAGNVLIWVRNGVTYRLEGELTRARALALAGTITPRGT